MRRLLPISLLALGLALLALTGCDREGDVFSDEQPKPEVNQPWPATTDEPIRDKQEAVDELEAERDDGPTAASETAVPSEREAALTPARERGDD